MHTWVASAVGSSFPQEDFEFTVHSVFPHAVNLRPSVEPSLLSLVSEPAKAHPRAAVVLRARWDQWGLAPGDRGTFGGGVLRFAPWLADLKVPLTRRPPEEERLLGWNADPEARRRGLLVAFQSVETLRIVRNADHTLPGFTVKFRQARENLAAAVAALSVSGALEACGALIGSGPGLTPTGDDFLCGFLAGLRVQSLSSPSLERFLEDFGAAVRDPLFGLSRRTNDISAAFLEEAFGGKFGSALVGFARAALGLTCGLAEAVAVLGTVGHSSGTDSAQGFLFAFRKEIGG